MFEVYFLHTYLNMECFFLYKFQASIVWKEP